MDVKERPTRTPSKSTQRPDSSESPGRYLLCANCRTRVAGEGDRIVVLGSHVHRRINPEGVEFEFGCFIDAPGVECWEHSTPDFSWFDGYRWVVVSCLECGVHLGWFFDERTPTFHGLILARLVTGEDEE
jgi:hypothetical protein